MYVMYKHTILITGASGYLGMELIRQLLQDGSFSVLALTSNVTKLARSFVDRGGGRLQCLQRTTDFVSVVPWKKIDLVINLAFARTELPQNRLVETLNFHKELFLAVKKAKVPALMNISSQSVYGSAPGLHSERSDLCPLGFYALTKCASEILLEAVFSDVAEIAVTNIRLDSIAGNKNLLPTFVREGIEKKRINLIGGKQVFSLLDVRDAASGIIALCKTEYSQWKHVYNLGWHNKIYSLIDLAKLTKIRLEKLGYNDIEICLQKNDELHTYAGMNSERITQDTGWIPRWGIEDIIDKTIDEYLEKQQVRK